MKVVVDFDNTLALGNYSRISLLAPNWALISRLQTMRETIKPKILVVTARGGKDGLSEVKKKEVYAGQIKDWLLKYNVPFDGISFKKEYANLYIDDQTIPPFEDFRTEKSSFTENPVIITAQTVVKYAGSALFEHEWYKVAKIRGFNVPDVLFANSECIITERIRYDRKPDAARFIYILDRFKEIKTEGVYRTYFNNIPKIKYSTTDTLNAVAALEHMEHPATFFHGDLSTTNILCFEDVEDSVLIDPNAKHIFGSYLTDAGKAIFSLIAYEQQFQEAQKIVERYGKQVLNFAVAEGLRVCKYRPGYISLVNNIADLI